MRSVAPGTTTSRRSSCRWAWWCTWPARDRAAGKAADVGWCSSGRLARRVVVPADGVAGDAGGVQPGQRLGHGQALGVARVGRVEQVARLEEEVGAALERTGDRRLPALPQPGAAGF